VSIRHFFHFGTVMRWVSHKFWFWLLSVHNLSESLPLALFRFNRWHQDQIQIFTSFELSLPSAFPFHEGLKAQSCRSAGRISKAECLCNSSPPFPRKMIVSLLSNVFFPFQDALPFFPLLRDLPARPAFFPGYNGWWQERSSCCPR